MSIENSDKIDNFDDRIEKVLISEDPDGAYMMVREYTYDQIQVLGDTMLSQLDFVKRNIISLHNIKIRGQEPDMSQIESWPRPLIDKIVKAYFVKFKEKPEESSEQQVAKKK